MTMAALTEIRDAISEAQLSQDDRDDLLYTFTQSVQAIESWKAHQIRSLQHDKAQITVLERLDETSVLITQDWAMKWLPQKYRETQADWFGKRGLSWHISVVVCRIAEDHKQQTFLHIIEQCSHDASAVVQIIHQILKTLKYQMQHSDCYHSVSMLSACRLMVAATGIHVKRVDFSDPQGGKGPCDRKAATIKAYVRRYINEGHNVLTACDFRDAILSYGGVKGVRVALVTDASQQPQQELSVGSASSTAFFTRKTVLRS